MFEVQKKKSREWLKLRAWNKGNSKQEENKVMSEINLIRGPFTKSPRKNTKFKETWDSRYIYQNELDKACFQHDIANGNFKDLARRTNFEEVLRGKAFNIPKTSRYDVYQKGLAAMFYQFVDNKTFCWSKLKMEICFFWKVY